MHSLVQLSTKYQQRLGELGFDLLHSFQKVQMSFTLKKRCNQKQIQQ